MIPAMRVALVGMVAMSSLVFAGGAPQDEKAWHKQLDGYVNGTGDDANGNNLREQHEKLTKQCGHDITVSFEWSTFDMKLWTSGYLTPAVCAGNDQLSDLASACAAGSAKAKKIKTLTCHYKPCAKLPDPPSGAPGSNLKATEFQYKLGKKGAALDETFCENSSNMGNSALAVFLRK